MVPWNVLSDIELLREINLFCTFVGNGWAKMGEHGYIFDTRVWLYMWRVNCISYPS